MSFPKSKLGSSSKEKSIAPTKAGSSSGSCIASMKGWLNASSTVILLRGLRSSILFNKSNASAGDPGNISERGIAGYGGRDSMYFKAYSFVISFLVSSSGVPLVVMIKFTYSI